MSLLSRFSLGLGALLSLFSLGLLSGCSVEPYCFDCVDDSVDAGAPACAA